MVIDLIKCYIVMMYMVVIYLLTWRKLFSSNFKIKGGDKINCDKLMVVAHPDDELLFGGRFLLERGGWKVICVTNASERSMNRFKHVTKTRRYEFMKVMDRIKAKYEMWDFEDNYYNCNWHMRMLTLNLQNEIRFNKYKMVVTHNSKGEYGHIQHKKLFEVLDKLVTKNFYVFNNAKVGINPWGDRIRKLLDIYASQGYAIRKHLHYVDNQSLKKLR